MRELNNPSKWGKLLTALVTPFKDDNTLNVKELERIAQYVVEEQQNDGIVLSGSTGESPTLSEEEKLLALEVVLKTVGDQAIVLFGAGSYDTAASAKLAQKAEKKGAHGIMLVNPCYNRPGQRGLIAHFSTICKATSLPVMLYNIPGRTAINLEIPTLLTLIETCPNLVALKEASGNINQISECCRQVPEHFKVYSGDDSLALPTLSVGGYGLVSVVAHVAGKQIKQMLEFFPENPRLAKDLHHQLFPVFSGLFMAPNPVPVKYALSLKGFDCERVRLPLVSLLESEKKEVRHALECIEKTELSCLNPVTPNS